MKKHEYRDEKFLWRKLVDLQGSFSEFYLIPGPWNWVPLILFLIGTQKIDKWPNLYRLRNNFMTVCWETVFEWIGDFQTYLFEAFEAIFQIDFSKFTTTSNWRKAYCSLWLKTFIYPSHNHSYTYCLLLLVSFPSIYYNFIYCLSLQILKNKKYNYSLPLSFSRRYCNTT